MTNSTTKLRINTEIKAKEIRVINNEGAQLGVLALKDALKIAEDESLDLVEVNPHAVPPVCRLMDYGKYKYKQTKKEKEAKKKQHVVKVKEVKLRPQTDEHDFEVKLENTKKFLEKGNKVKITLVFRGRELAHKEIGETMLKKFCNAVVESKTGAVESEAKMIGRHMTLILAPVKMR